MAKAEKPSKPKSSKSKATAKVSKGKGSKAKATASQHPEAPVSTEGMEQATPNDQHAHAEPHTSSQAENPVQAFNAYRSRMNDKMTAQGNKVLNRLFNLDTNAYAEGELPAVTKEMLGLVASMVLRCDDCIKYHLGKCHELGVSTGQMMEIFAVANIVGGTIVIPHTRRALEYWEALREA